MEGDEYVTHPGLVLYEVSRGIQSLIDDTIAKGISLNFIDSCSRAQYILHRYLRFLKQAFNLNLPIHLFILLIRLVRNRKTRKNRFASFIKGYLSSGVFQATYALCFPVAYGVGGLFTHRVFSSWWGYLASFLFSFTIFIEKASKQKVMGIYLLAQWTEAVIKSAKKQRKLWFLPQWEKIGLTLCLGSVSWAYYNLPDAERDDPVESLANYIIGKPEADRKPGPPAVCSETGHAAPALQTNPQYKN